MKPRLLVLILLLVAVASFITFARRHHTLRPVATIQGPPGDARAYEFLLAKNGDHVFRPVDRSWSAQGIDYYGGTAVTGVRWRGTRSLTIELAGLVSMDVDGEAGVIRCYGRSEGIAGSQPSAER